MGSSVVLDGDDLGFDFLVAISSMIAFLKGRRKKEEGRRKKRRTLRQAQGRRRSEKMLLALNVGLRNLLKNFTKYIHGLVIALVL